MASNTAMNIEIAIPAKEQMRKGFRGCARVCARGNLTPAYSSQLKPHLRVILIAFRTPQDLALGATALQ